MKKILIIFIFCLTFANTAYSAKVATTYGSVEITKVVSVYDGDTFTCDINQYPPIAGQKISIRIFGIDTPEMKDKNPQVKALAVKAKEFVKTRLTTAKTIELRNMRRDKYFRILADVFIDGKNLGSLLIDKGLAKPYYGGTKVIWK